MLTGLVPGVKGIGFGRYKWNRRRCLINPEWLALSIGVDTIITNTLPNTHFVHINVFSLWLNRRVMSGFFFSELFGEFFLTRLLKYHCLSGIENLLHLKTSCRRQQKIHNSKFSFKFSVDKFFFITELKLYKNTIKILNGIELHWNDRMFA